MADAAARNPTTVWQLTAEAPAARCRAVKIEVFRTSGRRPGTLRTRRLQTASRMPVSFLSLRGSAALSQFRQDKLVAALAAYR